MEVDAERKLIILLSHMPLRVEESKRVEIGMAVSVANHNLVHGGFDYDVQEGKILFRLSNSYTGCKVGKATLMYMIYCACGTIDDYNDKFLMLGKGMMTLEQFIQGENG